MILLGRTTTIFLVSYSMKKIAFMINITVVLVTGASGCGKSSMASTLSERVQRRNSNVALFRQDNYFTMPFLPYKERKDLSYESNCGIDFLKLVSDVEKWTSKQITRIKAAVLSREREQNIVDNIVIIIEGHLLGAAAEMVCAYCTKMLDEDSVQSLYTLCVLLQCSKEKCKARRLGRRSRTADEFNELSQYFDDFVWIGFENFGIPAMHSLRDCIENLREEAAHNKQICGGIIEISTELNSFDHNMDLVFNAMKSCNNLH